MLVFLGGGGAGLSALVNIFFDLGFENILVIDKYQSEITDKLQKKGIKVIIGEGKYNFQPNDIIFYSDAVVNSEDFKKVKNNIKFTYFQFVGEISKWFQTISIAGTHGKSSTTALALILAKNLKWKDFGLGIVGAFVPQLNNQNFYINQSAKEDIKLIFEKILTKKGARPSHLFKKYFFIIEADEFNKHFLLLDSFISLITKVDHDHKDIYPTEKEYLNSFIEFINKTRDFTFTNDEEFFEKVKNKINYPHLLKYIPLNLKINFDYIFGEHMVKNASLVYELYKYLGFHGEKILKEIKNFKGLRRRQEYLGKFNNLDIYTDYAHHPTEINAVYKAFKEKFPNKKFIVVFQPHQLFRFVSYETEFINSLKQFDKIFIYDIYSVREDELIKKLAKNTLPKHKQIKQIGENIAKKVNGKYIENIDNLIKEIKNENGILLVMTAGDLDYKIRNFLKKPKD